jgi:hypothetical protein
MHYRFIGKAISIVEPWASAVVFAGKDIENRPKRLRYRGPIALHASQRWWPEDLDRKIGIPGQGSRVRLEELILSGRRRYGLPPFDAAETRGHVIGLGMLVGCLERSRSPWFGGKYGWQLAGVVPIEPVPFKGKLNLWPCRFDYRPLVPQSRP